MKRILILVCLSFFYSGYAGGKLNFKVLFPKGMDVAKINILLDDGDGISYKNVTFKNNSITLDYEIKSKKAVLFISYVQDKQTTFTKTLLIDANSSYIIFNKTKNINPLASYTCKNAFDIEKSWQLKSLKNFALPETIANANDQKQLHLNRNDSTLKRYNASSKMLALKYWEYIKTHNRDYFFFMIFRTDVVPILMDEYKLELYETFNSAFPDSFTKSVEGNILRTVFEGNLYIKKGYDCPAFNLVDYSGDSISLQKLKGKNVMIAFWATWCSPCIAEIPLLKKIRSEYSEQELEIISVSFDHDSAAFTKALLKYNMNWKHVYGKNNMSDLFGNKPIPAVYVIGADGKIIFSSWEEPIGTLENILRSEIRISK